MDRAIRDTLYSRSYTRVVIDRQRLPFRQFSWAPYIDRVAHAASSPHHGVLGPVSPKDCHCICRDVSRDVVSEEGPRVGVLHHQASERIADIFYTSPSITGDLPKKQWLCNWTLKLENVEKVAGSGILPIW